MVVRVFVFYITWSPYYELRILDLFQMIRQFPPEGTPHKVLGKVIGKIWRAQHDNCWHSSKLTKVKNLVLIISDFTNTFYFKTNWYTVGMGEVIIHTDNNNVATKSEIKYDKGRS